jgi:non-heme chloroperoxidase
LCVHEAPLSGGFYFFLGYNVIVPPYVRQGLLSRHLNHDPVIEKMRKPMLLSYGERDAIVLLSMGKHIAGLAKHANISIYPNVGHAPFWEAPERFNRELREFRASV